MRGHGKSKRCATSEEKGVNMKILICVSLAGFLLYGKSADGADGFECRVSPKFSSGDSLAQTVTESLRQAKQRVTLALYGFNNAELADELVKLAKQGIAIKVKVDSAKGAEKKTGRIIDTLKGGGVQVQTVAPDGRNHNKFAVIDGTRVSPVLTIGRQKRKAIGRTC